MYTHLIYDLSSSCLSFAGGDAVTPVVGGLAGIEELQEAVSSCD